MGDNIFLKNSKKPELSDYMNFNVQGRGNLGDDIPLAVYRLMEFSLREQLMEQLGREEQIQIFRKAGYRAGVYFAENMLDTSLSLNEFIAGLQRRMEELKIGVLRVEKLDKETGKIVLTVSEDADSCLPIWEKSIRLWRLTAGLPGTECAGSVPVQKNDEVRAWKRITVKCFLNI